ncbi:MAG: NAD(P)/FAD-dependent oxidoreductase [Verrucomicrobiales bacterium]
MPPPSPHELIIIGGGAAGHFAAASLGEFWPEGHGKRILLLEKAPKVLAKVKISGGGRCNVTHDCEAPRPLVDHYPRGHRSLIGPFSRWGTRDTTAWFEARGVPLKSEADGRIFPLSDSSQSVIDCLQAAVRQAGAEVRTSTGVHSVQHAEGLFQLDLGGETLSTRRLLLATGGTRLAASTRLAEQLGHQLNPAIPSLFAFNIADSALCELSGLSVQNARLSLPGSKITSAGPLLITHRGLSGPAALKLSAWAAPFCHEKNYHFPLLINWLPDCEPARLLASAREKHPKRLVARHSPHPELPRRLWAYFCERAALAPELTWSHLPKDKARQLADFLTASRFEVSGQSTNKDEFVTCGGVPLKEINLKTMESKLCPGLFFAGEVMDIDGVTGGFNFQNAWTSARLAAENIAHSLSSDPT